MESRSSLSQVLRAGDRVLVASGAGEPLSLVADLLELSARTELGIELVQVQTGSSGRALEVAGNGGRILVPVPGRGTLPTRADVLPTSMFQLARSIADGTFPVDGVLFAGTPVGDDAVTAGICVDLVPAAFERARFRAVELNAALPHTVGDHLALGECQVVVHVERAPAVLEPLQVSPAATAIGEHVADLVGDGAAIEVGIGRALAGVGAALVGRGVEVSVHTGLASDWTRALVDAGVAVRPLGCGGGAPVVATVAMGSPGFYAWLDRNAAVRMVESRHAHDPLHLAGLSGFVAVNAASRVDLSGQVGVPAAASERRAVGGLLDFAIAGTYSGSSIIALESVDRHGRSQIVPSVEALQLPSQLVTHVVTEFGVARLAGRTWPERAREVLSVAHPDHRAELRAASVLM